VFLRFIPRFASRCAVLRRRFPVERSESGQQVPSRLTAKHMNALLLSSPLRGCEFLPSHQTRGSFAIALRNGSSSRCVYTSFIAALAWPVSFCRISCATSAFARAELNEWRSE
jgi:hypothetical protein